MQIELDSRWSERAAAIRFSEKVFRSAGLSFLIRKQKYILRKYNSYQMVPAMKTRIKTFERIEILMHVLFSFDETAATGYFDYRLQSSCDVWNFALIPRLQHNTIFLNRFYLFNRSQANQVVKLLRCFAI